MFDKVIKVTDTYPIMTTKKSFVIHKMLIGLFVFFCISCNTDKPFSVTKDYANFTCSVAGKNRRGSLYLPQKLRTPKPGVLLDEKPAIIIALHGADSNGALFQSFLAEQGGFERIADTANWIVVYPDGIMSRWDDGTDAAFITVIIDNLCRLYNADPTKVCLTGFSVGAAKLYDLMNLLQSPIAAYAPVAGTMRKSTSDELQNAAPVSVLMLHTKDDNQFLYEGIPEWDYLGVNETFNALCTHNGISTIESSVDPNDKETTRIYGQNDNATVKLIEGETGGHYWKNTYAAEISDFFYTTMNNGYRLSLSGIENGALVMPDTETILGIKEVFHQNATVPEKLSVRFLSDNQEMGTITKEPFTLRLPHLTQGLHTISAEVTYVDGDETYTRVSAINPSVLSVSASVTECEIVPVITANASSQEAPDLAARYAIDRSTARRWSSAWKDDQSIELDLGAIKSVCGCGLIWERAYAKDFTILVSTDRQQWTPVYKNDNANGGFEYASFPPNKARFIKIQGGKRNTEYGISLWEIVVIAQKNTVTK